MWGLKKKNEEKGVLAYHSDFFLGKNFVEANLKRELTSIIDDVLEPYIFQDLGFNNVYDDSIRKLAGTALSVRDIFLNCFMGMEQVIHKVFLGDGSSRLTFFLKGELKGGFLELGNLGRFRPESSLFIEPIFSQEEVELVRLCFQDLLFSYTSNRRASELNSKFIFKMHGFHALFTEPRNSEEAHIAQQNRDLLKENVQAIIDGQCGIIDNQDSIGLLEGNGNQQKVFSGHIESIYTEIARLLKVPLTRLLGYAPQGLNATGESDGLNYDLTLDRYRSKWLEPFFKEMNVEYKKVAKIDISFLKEVVDLHISLGLEPSDKIKERIQALGEEL